MNVVVDEDLQMWYSPKLDHHVPLTPEQHSQVIESYYKSFQVSPVSLDAARQLEAMVRADGGRLVLLQMPNRPDYHAQVQRTHRAEYEQQVVAWRQLGVELNVPFVNLDDATLCNLTIENYTDGVHLRPSGAKLFSAFLAHLVREQGWLSTR